MVKTLKLLSEVYFTSKDRINRVKYLIFSLPLLLIYGLILLSFKNIEDGMVRTLAKISLDIVILVLFSNITIKRLHDLNFTTNMALLLMVPTYNFLAIGLLVLIKGTKGQNKYGKDPLNKSDDPEVN